MEVEKGAGILLGIVMANFCHEIKGQEKFFVDFLKFSSIECPLFISTDEFDEDLGDASKNSTALIRYTRNKDEEKVAAHLQMLQLSGDLTMAVLIDKGHNKLINLLVNNLQLFEKGMAGLISETDITSDLHLKLRLDTRLFLYTSMKETIQLKEMYAINRKKIVQTVGTWKETTGLTVSTESIWERRTNLEGMLIKVATVSYPGFHELHYDKAGESITGGNGLFLEPFNILTKKLNFTVKYVTSNDGQYGALTKNGTWNGLIGMLQNEEADIAAAMLSVTQARGNVVSFSSAIAEEVVTLVSGPNIEPDTNPWIYVEIFPNSVWYVSCAMIICISICFVAIDYSGMNSMHDKFDSEKFTLMNGLGLSLTFFRQIYYDVNIKSQSTRILFFLSAITAYLLYIHYTAHLTATSTTAKKSQISSFTDVMRGGYQVSVLENSAYHDLLRYAKPGTAMYQVYQNTMKNRPGVFFQAQYLVDVDDLPTFLSSNKVLLYDSALYIRTLNKELTILNIQGSLDMNWRKNSKLFVIINQKS